MEDYIKHNCIKKKVTPLLYGNKDVWPWIETFCNTHDLEIQYVDDIMINNFGGEILSVRLIQLKTHVNNIPVQLSNLIDDTKISFPWLDNRNVYASYENYQVVKEQLRFHKLTRHILEICDHEIMWLHHKTVKLFRLDCEIPDELKRVLKLNSNLFSVNLSFAYPWHQFWYIAESPKIDRLVLDVCANYWGLAKILDNFNIIDLLHIQIAFRGAVENEYLYRHITRLINRKAVWKSTEFNINSHLFDYDKALIPEDTILYLIYQYGRHFKKIIWLHDYRGTTIFDNCIRELNMQIQNDDTVEIDLKHYKNLSANELITRMWRNSNSFKYTVKISNYRNFAGDFFLELVNLYQLDEIQIDVGYHLNYFTNAGIGLDLDEISSGADQSKTIRLVCIPRRSMAFYNGLTDFICFFKRIIQSEFQQKFFYLIITEIVIENWSIFSGLNIISIKFDNLELNIKDLEELGNGTNICSTLEFHDCANLNDTLLLKLIEPHVHFSRIIITGKTSVTRLFFYMRAEIRLHATGFFEYDFADETPVIEYDLYDHIAQAKYYNFDDCIVCLDDDQEYFNL